MKLIELSLMNIIKLSKVLRNKLFLFVTKKNSMFTQINHKLLKTLCSLIGKLHYDSTIYQQQQQQKQLLNFTVTALQNLTLLFRGFTYEYFIT